MSETELANPQSSTVAPPAEKKPEPAQVTLSTIGDVSLATEDALVSLELPSREKRWKAILAFFAVLYISSAGLAWLLVGARAWVRMVLVPLFPVLAATAAFWWRQRWKFHAKEWQFKLKIWEDALDSLGHEAINAVNAIRANLIGFRLANPGVNYPEHLDIIEEEAARIENVVQKSCDPVAWKGKKKKKKDDSQTPTQVGEDTRSRIAL